MYGPKENGCAEDQCKCSFFSQGDAPGQGSAQVQGLHSGAECGGSVCHAGEPLRLCFQLCAVSLCTLTTTTTTITTTQPRQKRHRGYVKDLQFSHQVSLYKRLLQQVSSTAGKWRQGQTRRGRSGNNSISTWSGEGSRRSSHISRDFHWAVKMSKSRTEGNGEHRLFTGSRSGHEILALEVVEHLLEHREKEGLQMVSQDVAPTSAFSPQGLWPWGNRTISVIKAGQWCPNGFTILGKAVSNFSHNLEGHLRKMPISSKSAERTSHVYSHWNELGWTLTFHPGKEGRKYVRASR